jgi:hypothetical protein
MLHYLNALLSFYHGDAARGDQAMLDFKAVVGEAALT